MLLQRVGHHDRDGNAHARRQHRFVLHWHIAAFVSGSHAIFPQAISSGLYSYRPIMLKAIIQRQHCAAHGRFEELYPSNSILPINHKPQKDLPSMTAATAHNSRVSSNTPMAHDRKHHRLKHSQSDTAIIGHHFRYRAPRTKKHSVQKMTSYTKGRRTKRPSVQKRISYKESLRTKRPPYKTAPRTKKSTAYKFRSWVHLLLH
jgi:hypothetical protein